jgi:ComF family protein
MPLRSLLDAMLDLLLPPRCTACLAILNNPAAFCDCCHQTVSWIRSSCPRCALPSKSDHPCDACRRLPPPFTRASSALLYGGQAALAIGRLKYGGGAHLARPLGEILRPLLPADDDWSIVPVPLHPSRLHQRGYNQATLLARAAVAGSTLRAAPWQALRRCRRTPSQADLDRWRRLDNVRGAFAAEARLVRGRRLLVIDDVMTTGATAMACADALLDAGAVEVRVLTLARAVT